MVTMSNNKVYIGYVTIIADPNQQHDRDWIELFLTLSGHIGMMSSWCTTHLRYILKLCNQHLIC